MSMMKLHYTIFALNIILNMPITICFESTWFGYKEMELQVKVLVATVFALSLFRHYLIQADTFCGDKNVADTCRKRCFDDCEARANRANLNDAVVKERIATETNLCVDKCFARDFLPLKSEDIPELPQYYETSRCLGRCAYPAHEKYCLEGYLSSFFYCECHSCCLQKADNKKCVRGCHLWFMRQWSPKPKHSCRYRPELENSPKTWCTDYCIFMALRLNPSLTWDDVPQIATGTAALCIRRCTSLVMSNVPIDYDVIEEPCTDIIKCITVAFTKFKVFTTYNMDYASIESNVRSQINLAGGIGEDNRKSTVFVSHLRKWSKNATNEFDVRRSPALDSMHNAGIKFTFGDDPGNPRNVIYPNVIQQNFPWENTGPVLAKAYSYNYNPSKIPGKFKYFAFQMKFEIEPCTRYKPEIFLLMVEQMRFEHEITLRIADTTTSLFPLTAMQLRSAISQRSDWSGLEYVGDVNDHMIEMKAKGHAFAKFGFDMIINGVHTGHDISPNACAQIQGCNHPKTPGVTKFCRILQPSSVQNDGDQPPRVILG